ncbi:MAG: alanine racemase [Blastocatellia bacterium]|nr:alanine racemase [Blastocatellia bacterium]
MNAEHPSEIFSGRPTWAEIRLDYLAHNYQCLRQYVGPTVQVMAMVKANAYGHGAVTCARHLEQACQADWFGVATIEEGIELREAGIDAPILCLGGFWHGQEQALLHHHITPTVFRLDMLATLHQAAAETGATVPVHLKFDTGMGRLGFQPGETEHCLAMLAHSPHLRVEGILTHFAAADDPAKNEFTALQIERYQDILNRFQRSGIQPRFHHLANSAGTHAHRAAHGNLVRIGGLLYGTAHDMTSPVIPMLPVKPVLALHSQIILVKTVDAGSSLGYGCTFITTRTSQIATIPIGYADGVSRTHSNRGEVLVHGRRVPVVGRISMDLTLIDVTEVEGATCGDQVTLIGQQATEEISAEEYARSGGTIGLEATTSLSYRVPRRYRKF